METRRDYLKDMDRFLGECDTACDELQQSVQDIEILFSEYGYIIPDSNNIHNHSTDNHENNTNTNKYPINNDTCLNRE